MPPPSARMAVTVAPATGSLAESVTIPTTAPDDVLTTGAAVSSAWTAGTAAPAANTDIRKPLRYCRDFMVLSPSALLEDQEYYLKTATKTARNSAFDPTHVRSRSLNRRHPSVRPEDPVGRPKLVKKRFLSVRKVLRNGRPEHQNLAIRVRARGPHLHGHGG